MMMIGKLKKIDSDTAIGLLGYLVMFSFLTGIIFIVLFFIKGSDWLNENIFLWLYDVTVYVFIIDIVIFLPLAFFRQTRIFSGLGFYLSHVFYVLTLWSWSLILVFEIWGKVSVIIGVIIFGVGVIPIAVLATLAKLMLGISGQLILLIILSLGVYQLGAFLIGSYFECREENTE
jgi:hypothetical protein